VPFDRSEPAFLNAGLSRTAVGHGGDVIGREELAIAVVLIAAMPLTVAKQCQAGRAEPLLTFYAFGSSKLLGHRRPVEDPPNLDAPASRVV
jgi:hypothetical protein